MTCAAFVAGASSGTAKPSVGDASWAIRARKSSWATLMMLGKQQGPMIRSWWSCAVQEVSNQLSVLGTFSRHLQQGKLQPRLITGGAAPQRCNCCGAQAGYAKAQHRSQHQNLFVCGVESVMVAWSLPMQETSARVTSAAAAVSPPPVLTAFVQCSALNQLSHGGLWCAQFDLLRNVRCCQSSILPP